jgi:hypothetical protein
MPLLEINKAFRRKDKRVVADGVPTKKVESFARSLQRIIRGLITPEVAKTILKEVRAGNIKAAADAIPWYDPANEESVKKWERLAKRLKALLKEHMEETGKKEMREAGLPIHFRVADEDKPVDPTKPVEPKEEPKKFKISWPVKRIFRGTLFGILEETPPPKSAPISESKASRDWLDIRVGGLIKEISGEQRASVNRMIMDQYNAGMRAEDIADNISATVGLLEREQKWVDDREITSYIDFRNAGLTEAQAKKRSKEVAAKYAKELLRKRGERIARTEFKQVESEGRFQAWSTAQEEGVLPQDVKREWVSAPPSSRPDRPCKICLDLDGQQVGIGESYYSNILQAPIRRPGTDSHPHCRCTEKLVVDR